jgi:hypothetical protein
MSETDVTRLFSGSELIRSMSPAVADGKGSARRELGLEPMPPRHWLPTLAARRWLSYEISVDHAIESTTPLKGLAADTQDVIRAKRPPCYRPITAGPPDGAMHNLDDSGIAWTYGAEIPGITPSYLPTADLGRRAAPWPDASQRGPPPGLPPPCRCQELVTGAPS